MLLQYCASYDIKGISSLCTAELISVIANTFIGVSCLIVFAVTQKLETRLRFRWPLHVFTWVFMILNGVCVVFNSVTWLLVAPGKGFVIVSQLLSLQTLVTVPLCYHSLEKFWSTRWLASLAVYYILAAVSKLMTVTSFSAVLHVITSWPGGADMRLLSALLQSLFFIVLLLLTIATFLADKPNVEFTQLVEDEMRYSFASSLFFSLSQRVLRKGYHNTLHLSDIQSRREEGKDEGVVNSLEVLWGSSAQTSLISCIYLTQKGAVTTSGVCLLCVMLLEFLPVYVIYGLVQNLAYDDAEHDMSSVNKMFTLGQYLSSSYGLLSMLVLGECLRSLLLQHHHYIVMMTGAALSSQLQAMVYKKLCSAARWELSKEHRPLITLFTRDIEAVASGVTVTHQLWRIPIQCTVCIVALYSLIQYSALISITTVLALVLLHTWLSHIRGGSESQLVKHKQGLTQLLGEYVTNLTLLKLSGNNELFKDKIVSEQCRVPSSPLLLLFSSIQITRTLLPVLLIVLTFLCSYLLPGSVTLPAGATVLLLLSMLQTLLSLAPSVAASAVSMSQACSDIEIFLNKESAELSENQEAGAEWTVKVVNGTFSWSSERMSTKVLTNINLTLGRGKLTMILGGPGSGKTSLLSALLGEVHTLVGGVSWSEGRSVAYVPQCPVMLEGGLLENVVFGETYYTERYLKVLTLCALSDDSDSDIVVDPKDYHRVNLARALYSTASTLILDEPLVRLAPNLQEQFFFESLVLFAGEEGRDVIMSTKDIQLLDHADQVVLLEGNTTLFVGTPTEAAEEHSVWLDELAVLEPTVQAAVQCVRVQSVSAAGERGSNKPVYKEWLQSCPVVYLTLCSVSMASSAVLLVTMLWWLCYWCHNNQVPTLSAPVAEPPSVPNFFFLIFAALATMLVQAVSIIFLNLTVKGAARVLFVDIVSSLSRATFSFIQSVGSNELMERFRTDLELVERPLMECLCTVLFVIVNSVACFIVQVIASPGCLIAILPLSLLLAWLYLFHLYSSRALRTIRSKVKHKLFNFYHESISCLALVRAYKADHRYTSTLTQSLRDEEDVTMATVTASRWFVLHQDLVTVVLVGCTMVATVSVNVQVEIGALALVLVIITAQRLGPLWGHLESGDFLLQSLRRCTEAAHHIPLEYETPRTAKGTETPYPDKDWPSKGAISFQEVFASCGAEEEPCLRNLTLDIAPTAHVGVYSSQGGGKDSLIPLIFRTLFVNNGLIKIDGIDLNKVSLSLLRSSLSLVPAEPPLYSGTIRHNLDPTGVYEDSELWEALERVQLKDLVTELPEGLAALASNIELSAFQLQRLYLAKALLKRSKLVLVEENKSRYSNKLLYQLISEELKESTVLIIAERSMTLKACTMLLLLEEGRIVGIGSHESLQAEDCPYYRHISKTISPPTSSSNY